MESATNHITLCGTLASAPEYSHSNHGRHFFSFDLEVMRLSGAVDLLPILASESLLAETEAAEGGTVCIEGQIRSFNSRSGIRKLVISVFAERITVCDAPHDNRVTLTGVLCKEPIYRRTPLGREICDVMLAVNRPYRRSDYLPCILWGRCAQEAAGHSVGSTVTIDGRLQSRQYIKIADGVPQRRTAYEISAVSAEFAQE